MYYVYIEEDVFNGEERHRYRFEISCLTQAWKKFHNLTAKYISQGYEVTKFVTE
jgi:hypothetical protein